MNQNLKIYLKLFLFSAILIFSSATLIGSNEDDCDCCGAVNCTICSDCGNCQECVAPEHGCPCEGDCNNLCTDACNKCLDCVGCQCLTCSCCNEKFYSPDTPPENFICYLCSIPCNNCSRCKNINCDYSCPCVQHGSCNNHCDGPCNKCIDCSECECADCACDGCDAKVANEGDRCSDCSSCPCSCSGCSACIKGSSGKCGGCNDCGSCGRCSAHGCPCFGICSDSCETCGSCKNCVGCFCSGGSIERNKKQAPGIGDCTWHRKQNGGVAEQNVGSSGSSGNMIMGGFHWVNGSSGNSSSRLNNRKSAKNWQKMSKRNRRRFLKSSYMKNGMSAKTANKKAKKDTRRTPGYTLMSFGKPLSYGKVNWVKTKRYRYGDSKSKNSNGGGSSKMAKPFFQRPDVSLPPLMMPSTKEADWQVSTATRNLKIELTPLHYEPPFGPPVFLNYTYIRERNTENKWSFNYSSYLRNGPASGYVGLGSCSDDQKVYLQITHPNAHTVEYIFNYKTNIVIKPENSKTDRLFITDDSVFVLRKDNSYEEYSRNSRHGKLLAISDRQGYNLEFLHNYSGVLTSIVDAAGCHTTVEYDGDTTIYTDPTGKKAEIEYDSGLIE